MQGKKKYKHYINGKRIYLRDVMPSDIKDSTYVSWMNDAEVVCYTESRFKRHTKQSLASSLFSIKKGGNLFLAIILKDNGRHLSTAQAGERHIGNIKVGPINRKHSFADIGLIIGDKSSWGRGYGTEAIKLMVSYCFNKLKLHKLNAGAYESNVGSIKAFKKAGFSEEGRLKKQYLCNGKCVDGILLGIVNKK